MLNIEEKSDIRSVDLKFQKSSDFRKISKIQNFSEAQNLSQNFSDVQIGNHTFFRCSDFFVKLLMRKGKTVVYAENKR